VKILVRVSNIVRRYIDPMKFAVFMGFFVNRFPSCSFGSFFIVYMAVCFVYFCLILQIMYSYCYDYVFLLFVCSVLYILFSSCQLAFSDYPNWGFSVLFPQF
jgi:hypothetical protein